MNLVASISQLTPEELEAFLKDLLTRSETETLEQRWQIAQLLESGKSYKEIEKLTGASSATIAKVSEFLHHGYDGYKSTLEKL